MSLLLSDEELNKELTKIFSGGVHAKGNEYGGYPTYFTEPYYIWVNERINTAMNLINTQKRLYAEMVIGEDLSLAEYRPNLIPDTNIETAIQIEGKNRHNELLRQMRARIK